MILLQTVAKWRYVKLCAFFLGHCVFLHWYCFQVTENCIIDFSMSVFCTSFL